MQPSKTIAVIVRDEALLASLTFALGVEGFAVEASAHWPAGLTERGDVGCIVLDSENYRIDRAAREGLTAGLHPVLFLSDSLSPVPEEAGVTGIGKPFQGDELVAAIRRMVAETLPRRG